MPTARSSVSTAGSAPTTKRATVESRLAKLDTRVEALGEGLSALQAHRAASAGEAVAQELQALRAAQEKAGARMDKLVRSVRQAFSDLHTRRALEAQTLGRSASADAKSTTHSLRDLAERQLRLEQRFASTYQEFARIKAAREAVRAAHVGTAESAAAEATVQCATDAAAAATAAAEKAERAALAAARQVEAQAELQRAAKSEAARREALVHARLEALARAVEDVATSSDRGDAAEAEARERALQGLSRQVHEWQLEQAARVQALEGSARATQRGLTSARRDVGNLWIAAGLRQPDSLEPSPRPAVERAAEAVHEELAREVDLGLGAGLGETRTWAAEGSAAAGSCWTERSRSRPRSDESALKSPPTAGSSAAGSSAAGSTGRAGICAGSPARVSG